MTYKQVTSVNSSTLPGAIILYWRVKDSFNSTRWLPKVLLGPAESISLTGTGSFVDGSTLENFSRLANEWKAETQNLSSISRKESHPAYRKIVALGPKVIPLILRRLREEPDFWFGALRSLTNQNPVTQSMRGDINAMAQAWLKWGEKNGYR